MIEEEESSLAAMFDHFDQFEHWGRSGPRGYFVKREDGTRRHLTEVTGDKAAAFLKSCRPEEPFCLTLCFNAPHAQDDDPQQYFWPTRFDQLYRDATIPPPRNAEPAFFAAQPGFIRNSLGRERWRWRFDTPSKYQAMMKGMYRMVSGVDHVVGRVRSVLRDRGLHRNTVLVFTSDNGMFFGERGLSDCWLLYEECLRVPLLLYDPRRGVGGVVREEMALNLDLAPTLLALAGMDSFYQRAYAMISAPEARDAFDLNKEPAKLRDEYGRNTAGGRFLLARRLVESGVRMVSTTYGGWDHHSNIAAANGGQMRVVRRS